MISAFCPGHITCFFHPVRTDGMLTTGSRGVGIRLSKGTTVTLEERSDSKLKITMDGKSQGCKITEYAIREILPDAGFDVTVENELPVGQGFGMSASGAIASALCACEFAGKDPQDAFRAAHIAEIKGGGGLGDVSALTCGSSFPVRVKAGLPPYGEVIGADIEDMELSLAVLDGPLYTGATLSDPGTSEKIARMGEMCVDRFLADGNKASLFALSNEFSKNIGIETDKITSLIGRISKTHNAGMCMLGHSIFTDMPCDVLKGITDAEVFSCRSTDRMPAVIRRA